MGKVIKFPGMDGPEEVGASVEAVDPELASLTEEELELVHEAAKERGISPELLHISIPEIKAAQEAIDTMLAHFKGKNLGVSGETSRLREHMVAEYGLQRVFQMMSESTIRDWNQRPALYGALAMRVLEELEPLEPKQEEDSGGSPEDET